MFMLVFRGCTRQPAPLSGWCFRLDWDLLDKLPATYPKKHPITTSLNQSVQGFNFRVNVHPPNELNFLYPTTPQFEFTWKPKIAGVFVDDGVFPFPKGANQRTRTKLVEFCRCSLFLRWTAFGISGGCFSNFRRFQASRAGIFHPESGQRSTVRPLGGWPWRMGFWSKQIWKMLETWHSHEIWHQIKCRNLQLVMKFADINSCWVGSNTQ